MSGKKSNSFLKRVASLFSSSKEETNSTPDSVEIIDDHLDEFFGADEDIVVFHEIVSETIHRDVFFIKANDERAYHIILSCGMSARPMCVPEDDDASPYAEVMMLLPKEWNLEQESFDDEKNYWPIRLIKALMILPHENETWLANGHTFTYQDSKEFAEGIGFNSVMLAYSMELSQGFTEIQKPSGEFIDIFTLIPLYPEEYDFKVKNDSKALLEKLDAFNIQEVVQIGRKNTCLE